MPGDQNLLGLRYQFVRTATLNPAGLPPAWYYHAGKNQGRLQFDDSYVSSIQLGNSRAMVPDIFSEGSVETNIRGQGFEYCCGIAEIGNFGDVILEDAIRDIKEELVSLRDDDYGAAVATTIAEQKAAITALRKCGFHILRRFRNPNSGGTVVTLWYKNLN
jgi:hypothetical protein